MSVSVRFILLVCVAIFGLNVYLYLEQSDLNSVSERQAIQNTYGGDQNATSDYQEEAMSQGVYRSVD